MKSKGLNGVIFWLYPEKWKEGQWWLGWKWFWYRQAFHALGGAMIGLSAWGLWYLYQYMPAIIGGLLAGAIMAKEMVEKDHQAWYKTAMDLVFWLMPYVALVLVLTR